MDRNTILAIILCTIVVVVGMTIQTTFFAPQPTEVEIPAETVSTEQNTEVPESVTLVKTADKKEASQFDVKSKVLDVTFNTKGATISSIKMLDHMDKDAPVDLVFKDETDTNLFMLYAGDEAVDSVFDYSITDADNKTIVRFSKDFDTVQGKKVNITKSYAISKNSEYLFQIAVEVKSLDGTPVSLGSDSSLYTLSIGPQIGPAFETLSGNYEYRRIYLKSSDKNKKKMVSVPKSGTYTSSNPVDWASLSGKYFSYIFIPSNKETISSFSVKEVKDSDAAIKQKDIMYFTRSASGDNKVTDVYSFYCGPQIAKNLQIFDRSQDNVFGLADLNLKKILDTSWLSWLETILMYLLLALYHIIPNYGIAIIILTIAIKLALYPLSKKSMDATAKMSALSPKMEEIKAKYPDDPNAQNAAMSKLYKEEGINPAGSCLPMLIQFPILIAMYGLLNKHFELRGAMFIPGWIPDLSLPDTVARLPFAIPLLGNAIHLLPILYTVSMIFSMKITQNGSQTAAGQESTMFMMTYGMPIIFFFILYNAPSGLLLYWSVMNAISIGQQVVVNKKKKGSFAAEIKAKDEEKMNKKKAKRR